MDFGKWAFSNSGLVHLFIVVLIMGGLYAYYDMSKLEDPELKVRQALVVGVYPGASAHEVELELVDPLEKAIRQTPNVSTVQSFCYADMCLMTVELLSTVPPAELEQHWDIMRRKVFGTSLPEGVRTVQVRDDFGDVFGMFYALTGDGLSDKQLSDYAEFIKREIANLDGVSRVDIYGKREECINVILRQDKMANLGVSPIEVIQTLNGQTETVYGGYFDNGTNRVRLTVGDRSTTVEDIANLILQGHEQDQLRLSDITDVVREYDEPQRNTMQYDGEKALGISISAVSGTDITKIGNAVEARMAQLKNQMPVGVEVHKVFYQPERVTDALGTFLLNLLESVLLVVAVLMIFMGLRSGVIIGYSLIIIVCGSVLVLYFMDGTLQRVSLGSFILAMGMLVDNAIVIVDGVLVDKKAGLSQMEALTSTGRQTAMPLLGATLIAILAFLPIYLSPDTTGLYVRDLFIVMSVSLLLSWLLALVHVPMMCRNLLFGRVDEHSEKVHEKRNARKKSSQKDASWLENWAQNQLDALLNHLLNHRVLTLLGLVVLLAVAALCYRFVPQAFFPDMEYDQLYMEYKLPEGSNYTQVQQDLAQIQAYLKQRPEVTHIVESTGGTPSRYNLVRSVATPSLAYGELIVSFESPKALVKNIEEIQAEVSAMFPDAYVKFKRYNLMYKKYPIEAQFSGSDPAVLHALSDSCRAIMQRTGAVRLITTDWDPKVPILNIHYNQSNARRLGYSRKDVGTSMLSVAGGLPVGRFYDGIHLEKVYVKVVDKDGLPVEDMSEASVFGMLPNFGSVLNKETLMGAITGQIEQDEIIHRLLSPSPLRQMCDSVSVEWEDPIVIRYNGRRAQRVQCSPVAGLGTEAARQEVEKALQVQLQIPEGYELTWVGEKAASDQSMKYLFKNYPLAIILMIAILVMLFKDFKVPALLFCCIPLIFIGVIPAILISGKTFGFVAICGVLGLVGMMLKNGIVLMDEIKLQIASGKDKRQALIDSSKSRLRPVMMASATTILGMIPLLPDAMFGSMAAAIMGGLVMATLVCLLIIPVFYALFYKIK
ncbi:MAG: efflux RND transporter permease subunit [Bacteroidales bacterium]|nr:efflux RND transporter permease subunit [Bacteroidales bacterium]